MRREGWTLQAIGAAMEPKISAPRVHDIIRVALSKTETAPAKELITLELSRLDELQTTFYTKAISGDPAALDRVLAIMDRRAKMLGLNAAEKVQVEEVGELARAKTSLLEKLNKMAARKLAPAEPEIITIDAKAE